MPPALCLTSFLLCFFFVCVYRGHTPAASDYQLLEVARRLEMYGIRLHPAKDREGTVLSLAVAHTGVVVFQVSSTGLWVNSVKNEDCKKSYMKIGNTEAFVLKAWIKS